MSIEPVEGLEDLEFIRKHWAAETELWNGRAVTAENICCFRNEIEQRIRSLADRDYLFLGGDLSLPNLSFSRPTLTQRTVENLDFSSQREIAPLGLGKSIKKFWKKHKKEIIITLAVIVVVTIVVVAVTCAAGATAGVAAAAGSAMLEGLSSDDERPTTANNDPPPKPKPIAEIPPSPGTPAVTILEDGVLIGDRYSSHEEVALYQAKQEALLPSLHPSTLDYEKPLLADPPSPCEAPFEERRPLRFWEDLSLHSAATPQPAATTQPAEQLKTVAETLPPPPPAPADNSTTETSAAPPVTFLKDGILIGDRYSSHEEIALYKSRQEALLPSLYPSDHPTYEKTLLQSLLDKYPLVADSYPPCEMFVEEKEPLAVRFWEGIKNFCSRFAEPKKPAFPDPEKSINVKTAGTNPPHIGIGFMNGINTPFKGTEEGNAAYLKQFAGEHSIDWTYNRTNAPWNDVGEVFALNYFGCSPKTAKLAIANWTEFHERNKDNPQAKYLQFCHSQGAIHIRNGLEQAPQEIRDRVIVVAIAPGAIITPDLCFQSFNYASKRDVVPYGELVFASGLDPNECGISKVTQDVLERRQHLILLDPHPEAPLFDHDFQSKTFADIIDDHMRKYLKQKGIYE